MYMWNNDEQELKDKINNRSFEGLKIKVTKIIKKRYISCVNAEKNDFLREYIKLYIKYDTEGLNKRFACMHE